FVRDLSADKLSSRTVPCVFLGFPPDAPGWQFYHPTSRRGLSSQDVTFYKSVPYYRLFPYRTAPLPPPPPLVLAPRPPPVDPLPPQGPSPSGVSQVDAVEPVEVVVDSGAARGAEHAGARSRGAEPERAEPGGAEFEGVESGGAEPGVAESGGAEPEGAEPARVESGGVAPGGPSGASSRWEPLSPQQLREWFARRWRRAAGASGATGEWFARRWRRAAGASVSTGAVGPGGAGAGAGGATGVGADAGGAGAVPSGFGCAARPCPYFVPLLEKVLGLLPSTGPAPSLEYSQPVQSESHLLPASPLLAPSPYTGPTGGLTERREPESRPASPVRVARAGHRGSCQRPPLVPGTHQMALRPSTAPQRVPLPSPPESSLPTLADPESDSLRAASPTVTRPQATVATDPSFDSTAASALVAELVYFGAHCRLDYAASLVAEFSACLLCRPPVSPPVIKARYVAQGFSQRQGVDFFQTFSPTPKMTTLRVLLHVPTQRDYELHSLDFCTAFLQGSLHEEIWLRRPPGFTGSFPDGTQWSLQRPVYGLRQAPREWHDTLRTTLAALGFAPSSADPSLFLRTDTTLPPFYILVYVVDLVFATADTAGLAHVKSELQKRHTCTDLGDLRSYLGLQITRERARHTSTLTQSHRVQQVLQRFNFTYSSPQATPLSTHHSLSALPSDESVEPSGSYPELVGCLMYLMTCTRPDLAYPLSNLTRYVAPGRHRPEHMDAAKRVLCYLCSTSGMGLVLGRQARVVLTGHTDASWVDDLATQRSSQGYPFSLGSGSVLWRSTRSSSVLSSSCEAEIYAGAMAA
ncbi:unnamed protein product, partial [Closterium sp. NIES-54]